MFIFNNRSKTSIFSAYALVSVVGFAGLWFGVKGSENLSSTESFLAFYGFFCTTVIFYMLASQKSMIENAFEMIHEESTDRTREIEAVHRSIDGSTDSIRRELYAIEQNCNKGDCCNSKSAF